MSPNYLAQFAQGSPPKNLNGFYQGRLLQVVPQNWLERLGGSIAKFWLPWKGKIFDNEKSTGINLVESYAGKLLGGRYGKEVVEESRGAQVFPFKTRVEEGIEGRVKVLKLDYDMPENPERVRKVVDELVEIEEGVYLGKAYLKEESGFRLVAFFELRDREHKTFDKKKRLSV